MRQVDYESVESGNAVPSPITPSVNPQLTMARPTVESRLNRNELSGVPTAGCRVACPHGFAWACLQALRRAWQAGLVEADEPSAIRGRTGSRVKHADFSSTLPSRRDRTPDADSASRGSNPKCLKIAHAHLATVASRGAGRTISGYDILPRIQGHAHAKPWASHPASAFRLPHVHLGV